MKLFQVLSAVVSTSEIASVDVLRIEPQPPLGWHSEPQLALLSRGVA